MQPLKVWHKKRPYRGQVTAKSLQPSTLTTDNQGVGIRHNQAYYRSVRTYKDGLGINTLFGNDGLGINTDTQTLFIFTDRVLVNNSLPETQRAARFPMYSFTLYVRQPEPQQKRSPMCPIVCCV